jgi:hypothetical protein
MHKEVQTMRRFQTGKVVEINKSIDEDQYEVTVKVQEEIYKTKFFNPTFKQGDPVTVIFDDEKFVGINDKDE